MDIGKPVREYIVAPLELPEPLRTAPSIEPSYAPEVEPDRKEVPVGAPEEEEGG